MGILTHVPVLRADRPLREAVEALRQVDAPALPVADEHGRFCGIFGEREFIAAIFPGYLGELRYAGFLPARSTPRSSAAPAASPSRCSTSPTASRSPSARASPTPSWRRPSSTTAC